MAKRITALHLIVLVLLAILPLCRAFTVPSTPSCKVKHQGFAFRQPHQLMLQMSEPSSPESDIGNTATTTAPKPAAAVACPDCDRCDGSGRILGGIGMIAPWWPIKAYRPCPNFIDRGGVYQRSGQGLDEIAFGRDSTFNAGE
ncbi:hypothetical protein MPSEU_000608800 [Mayamaea pseudoterrestris]|nr:hypothetical protein MPSEU_000608800 [Mayamaea pseudoterrestris]